MMMRRASLLLLALVVLAAGCEPAPPPGAPVTMSDPGAPTAAAGASASTAAARPSAPPSDATDDAVRVLVQSWSRALDAHDVAALASMYAERVQFYRREVPRAAVVAMKQRALGPGSTFHQSIVGDVAIARADGGVFRATFRKRSGSGKQSEVSAYLGVARGDGGALLIVEESDEQSSRSRAELAPRDACYAAASSVVNALPAVKKTLADTQREIDAHYKDRAMGGIGPIDEEDGFTASIGVHQPSRFEGLVFYDVHGGKLSVTVGGEDLLLPKDQQEAVAKACAAAFTTKGP